MNTICGRCALFLLSPAKSLAGELGRVRCRWETFQLAWISLVLNSNINITTHMKRIRKISILPCWWCKVYIVRSLYWQCVFTEWLTFGEFVDIRQHTAIHQLLILKVLAGSKLRQLPCCLSCIFSFSKGTIPHAKLRLAHPKIDLQEQTVFIFVIQFKAMLL